MINSPESEKTMDAGVRPSSLADVAAAKVKSPG
ncbi:MAG: hypothetical protein RLZZ82_721, partial [Actinomycetota bacterium]